MSEEILKALTQLFAIITKQDGGVTEKERNFVISFFQQELDQDSIKEYLELYDQFAGYGEDIDKEEEDEEGGKTKKKKLTSVRDSVRTLAICKKINKTLTQKQKVVVLIKLLELVSSDNNFTPQRMEIIDTVSTVFNIIKNEFKLIESFVIKQNSTELKEFEEILAVSDETSIEQTLHVHADIKGEILFMSVNSVDMYFVKYTGGEEINLNGFIMKPFQVYLFSHGSTIKTPKGAALYYSDLIRQFLSEEEIVKLSFNAENIYFKFPNGETGLRNVNIFEGPGQLVGIMGASGAGKTTLLNVLAGIEKPSEGKILINGYDLNADHDELQGIIGYVAQDDLLIEELTVYQNLYYNAKLCFAHLNEDEIHKRVMDTLESLGLDQRKDLKVGSVLDKTISGGQRKRLNIALELIREPAVMFVDEPTSGLSSRDSENVIDLLKELTLKGKLIFVVIHQPSSDIYKMFDKMVIMDTGGYQIFYGHPVEAVTYFKKTTNQVDAERGVCPTCANVNPEQIFNIVEAKVVDEYGQLTSKRKVNPTQWREFFMENFQLSRVEDVKEEPHSTLKIPNRLKQSVIFTVRDTLSKISNKQYLFINLLEAPLLALLLAFIIKYRSAPGGEEYVFRFNENLPAFLLMSIIVALFMGLTVSAEEIIRDRKILKRESFLNLSWNSYLQSKLLILFTLSAIQTLTYVIIGVLVLEIKGMTFSIWAVLFSTSCFANVLGLNVSSAFKSAVTVYILIPLLLIPQMILSGLLFSFDKLNDFVSTKGKVPIVADLMVSRWAYEAMTVDIFKNNDYQAPFYEIEAVEKMADFKSSFKTKKIREKLRYVENNLDSKQEKDIQSVDNALLIIRNSIENEEFKGNLEGQDIATLLKRENFNAETIQKIDTYVNLLRDHYLNEFNLAIKKKETLQYFLENNKEYDFNLNEVKNEYFNESLSDLVRNVTVADRVIEFKGELVQQIDPVFHKPVKPDNPLNYRTHFFAPEKYFAGLYVDTFYFNIIVIWFMSLLLYITLYFELFGKMLAYFSRFSFKKKA
ncbi:ATP-binding cassette domain-containing protein [Marivirga sp. S37H4]|uniref:ATP-binding cassette domain-containing protein n=1 Tax=Marivirga aurantiaca TaxID=2802615 RepID=A0A934WVF2_9BACT|nr:ATP-binding cassette domain-containing protein [Marivirga aurantiaca]MBK6263662.1 ATP-binding cassette domain-containing protein [Marivirga aurantiaca]